MGERLPRLSIALVSATALSYEILLMKLFSIIQWHHFAYMIISLALLGYGASGTFLSLFGTRLLRFFPYAYITNILLFGVSSLGCFMIAQSIPFNPLELFWEARQNLWLLGLYLLLALPFFFAANAVALAFIRYKTQIAQLYGADLFGAGVGSLGVLALLYLYFPESVLQLVALSALLSAAIAAKELSLRPKAGLLLLFGLSLAAILLPARQFELKMNDYKELSQTLRISGTKVIEERSSPLGKLSVVKSPEVPFRYAPGLSIASTVEPPQQLGVFTNGEGMSAITRYPASMERLAYLDYQTSALAYHLGVAKNVLVVGAGGGSEILQALYHNAETVDAVEINPQMAELVGTAYAEFAGDIYARENVTVHTAEARGFVASSQKQFDLIQMAMVDSFGSSSAGLGSLSENYLYTVEAFEIYLKHLKPGGYLSLSRWLKLPPRDTLKLFATALEALRKSGVENPEKRLAVIRGWQTSTLVVKNGSFEPGEIERLRRFCDERFFDAAYYDGLDAIGVNRYNVLEKPIFFEGMNALVQDAERFFHAYRFDVTPATDNRPYFYHFFKWETLPEIFALRGAGGLHLLEWGYLVLVAALVQAVAVSVVLILLPLIWLRKAHKSAVAAGPAKVLLYFFALGLGFLFVEIYFIQRFILFLSHPLYTAAVVLSSFLIFAGLGSGFSRGLSERIGHRATARRGIVALLLLGLLYAVTLESIFAVLMLQGDLLKIAASVALIAPLAFAMGMPFAMGLGELGKHSQSLIPWAWGVNGCASVISAILATLVAIHYGFAAVMTLALLFYLLAYISFPQKER